MYGWYERAMNVLADVLGTEAAQLRSQAVRTFAAAFNLDRDSVNVGDETIIRRVDGSARAIIPIVVGQPAWIDVSVAIEFMGDAYTGSIRRIIREDIVVGDASWVAMDNPYENYALAGREMARLNSARVPHTVSA